MASKKTIIKDLHDLQIRISKLEEDINEHYKEWTLSDKEVMSIDVGFYSEDNIKEFIKRLKIKLRDTVYSDQPLSETFGEIDNLLGDKLKQS